MIFRNCYMKFHEPSGKWNLWQFWNITSSIYAKYHVHIMLLFVYTTTHTWFVIFTCRYFKLSWNTTALSQSNCRNFSCSSITFGNSTMCKYRQRGFIWMVTLQDFVRRHKSESHLNVQNSIKHSGSEFRVKQQINGKILTGTLLLLRHMKRQVLKFRLRGRRYPCSFS